MRYTIGLFLLVTIALSGCGADEDTLATVGDKTISKQQFEAYLKFKRLNPRDEAHRQKLIEQFIERETFAAAVEKAALLDKTMMDVELNEFRKEMLISRYFEKYLNDKVSDQALQNYYSANQTNYAENKIHVQHVMVRTNKNMTDTERKAKLTTVQEAYSKIKAGKDFASIAKDYSEDTISSKKGGDLGWIKQGAIDKVFSEKVFVMKKGDISEPFETKFGYHIVKVIDSPATVKRPFEAVKGDIRYQLRNQSKQAELERLVSTIKVKR